MNMKQDKETEERVNAFLEAYKAISDEHKIDFVHYPAFVPDGNGGFKVMIQSFPVDITDQPVKSPFIADKK